MHNLIVNKGEPILIIAEIGSNHNGSLDTAFKLIEVSAACGANVVKFQSFLVDDLLAANDPNHERLRKLQLRREWYPRLMEHCKICGVRFLSTATSFTTLEWMEAFGVWGYKVASCNITFRPLIDRLVEIGKPVIFSTGLARLEEIKTLSDRLQKGGLQEFAFLHCVSRYPAPPESLRLRNITLLQELLPCPVGFSDHSTGTHMAVAAVALGARIVEKHISLNKQGIGMDHDVAILPDEFSIFVKALRDAERALIADIDPDLDNMFTMRRSLHFSRDVVKGHRISKEDIKFVRPEDGLPPDAFANVVGKIVNRACQKNQPILWEHIDESD